MACAPRKEGSSGGVEVDDAPFVGPEQRRSHDAHVARQADQFDARLVEPPHYLALEVGLRGELAGGKDVALDAVGGSPLHDRRSGPVADHQRHLGLQLARIARRGDGLEVGAVAAGEYRNPSLHGTNG